MQLLCVMNTTNSFAEAARRAFDNLSLELQISNDDDNFTKEIKNLSRSRKNVDQEEFYKYLEFENEDEDCDISSSEGCSEEEEC